MSAADGLSGIAVVPTNSSTEVGDENIWRNLLSEVSSKSSNSLQGGAVIILGDKQSGKSSLLAKFEKQERPQKGSSPLEYHVLNVQNDFRDSSYAYQLGTAGGLGTVENLVLPVWTLDGEKTFGPLLKFAFPPSPSKAVVLICASIDNTNLINSIRRWTNIYTQQVDQKFDRATVNEAKQAQERYWQEYVEPVECSMTTSMVTGLEDVGLLPLARGVLVENCGSSVVVVVTKSDLGIGICEQQAIRVLVQVRKLCLEMGAALVYTSSKNTKNIQLLYKYILHRAFGLPFTMSAQLIDRDAIFVPAGFDGDSKIDIIKEGVTDIDLPLEPTREKLPLLKESIADYEPHQGFLQRLAMIEKTAPAPTPKAKALVDDGSDTSSPLASFFSNLLKDKPTGMSSPRAPASQAEAKMQLDRILASNSNVDTNDSSA